MGEAKRRKGQDPSFGKAKVKSNFDLLTLVPAQLPLQQQLEDDWIETLEWLQKPWIGHEQVQDITTSYQIVKELFWRVVLELVVKEKWLKNYQIPSGRAFQNLAKPKAKLLFQILELTIQCHSFASKEYLGNPPPNANCWFGLVFIEYRIADLYSDMEKRPNLEKDKRELRKNLIEELLEGRNPYPSGSHMAHLINVALTFKSPQFEEDYLLPFIRAVRGDVNHSGVDGQISAVWVEKDGLYTSLPGNGKGSGKGKQLIWQFKDLSSINK